MKRLFAALGALAVLVSVAAWAAQTVTIKTTTPIVIGKTQTVKGQFADLNAAAREDGLGQTTLTGKASYFHLSGGRTRTTVHWQTLTWTQGTETNDKTLDKPLVSQFTTSDARVEPQTKLVAKGDLQSIADAFDAMKQRASDSVGASHDVLHKVTNNKDVTTKQMVSNQPQGSAFGGGLGGAGGYGSSGSGTSSSSGSSTPSTNSSNTTQAGASGLNTDMVVTSWQSCDPRVDLPSNLVYPQAKKVETTQSGQQQSVGQCQDHGTAVPIQADYSKCSMSIDLSSLQAVPQYQRYAVVDGNRKDIGSCTVDPAKAISIQATDTGCSMRVDYQKGVAIQQQQLYYTDDSGAKVNVGSCQDGPRAFKLYQTSMTCANYIDQGSGASFPQNRWAYKDDSGKETYVSDCAPSTNTGWVSCDARVDETTGMVYQQQKPVTMSNTGQVSVGKCQDKGTITPIQREYTSCDLNFDFVAMKAYQQYKEYAVLNGQRLDISSCTIDPQKFTPLQATDTGCGVRNDFQNGVAVQQQQIFYLDDTGKTVNVGDCRDSSTKYSLYQTGLTCTDTVDQTNGVVIPQERWAFKLGDGTVQYATACAPVSSTGIKIQEENCDPKYQHDWTNHVSYLMTKSYYVGLDGNQHIISDCHRNPSISFVHQHDQTKCGITNDDTNLLTHWNADTYIVTPDEGTLEIAGCAEYNSPTPYAYVSSSTKKTSVSGIPIYNGPHTANQVVSIPSDVTFTGVTLQCGVLYNGQGDLSGAGTSWNYFGYQSTGNLIGCMNDSAPATSLLCITRNYKTYLRGDGTTYSQSNGGTASLMIGANPQYTLAKTAHCP